MAGWWCAPAESRAVCDAQRSPPVRISRVLVILALLLAAIGWLVLRLPALGAMPEGERLQKMQ